MLIDGLGISFVAFLLAVSFGGVPLLGFYLLQTVVAFVYYLIFEATSGATLGKMAMGIRVVKQDGSQIGFRPSLVRNLLRIVELWLLAPYLLSAILVRTSPTRQRLGDRAAGTFVVRRSSLQGRAA